MVKRRILAVLLMMVLLLLPLTTFAEGEKEGGSAGTPEAVSAAAESLSDGKKADGAVLSFSLPGDTIGRKKSMKLSVKAEGREITKKTVIKYASLDETVAVIKNGAVVGVAPGTARLTATATFEDGTVLEAETPITVIVPLTGLKISRQVEVFINEERKIGDLLTFVPADTTEKGLTYAVEDASVASVSADGTLKGLNGGKTVLMITADSGSARPVSAKCSVIVSEAVSSIELKEQTVTVGKRKKVQLEARVLPESATNQKLIWTSEDSKVATVSKTGLVTGVGNGTTRITCTAADGSGATATAEVRVITAVSSVKLGGKAMGIISGTKKTVQATVLPADATNPALKWQSDDSSVARVDSRGEISAVSTGMCTVTATATDGSGIRASIKVYVEPVNPVSVEEIRWTTFFGIRDGHMGVRARNLCSYLKIKSFRYTVRTSVFWGSSQSEELKYNGKVISPGKLGKSKMSKYVVPGFTTASQVSITVTSVTFTDGTGYAIPSAWQENANFGI